ncbi:hypothetical protein EGW08_000311 [Elysia chlorotica]|uniref:Uncharacterized protein n=1 Tax=Elysia chlorotica TaxID=188477 RepID=A0A433UDQ7_ELYCH|nr:hypothetical protein EGW08_000311 [Elysia chlorotica]
MPVEEDVHKLRNFILEEMEKLATDQYKKWDAHDFIKMRNLIVSRLTMFNARRGGEPARLTLEEWKEAAGDAWIDPQMVQTIEDPLEKALFNQFKLAYQAGKGSKKLVPLLIPNDTVKPIEKLIEQRKEIDVPDENPFVFANTSCSQDHVIGWQSIKAVIKMMGPVLERPDLLIADKFRHRMSTLFAILDLPASERDTFYRHMGHSEEINKHVYQCPLSIGEVVKVGGFLKKVDEPSAFNEAPRAEYQYPSIAPEETGELNGDASQEKETNEQACQEHLSCVQDERIKSPVVEPRQDIGNKSSSKPRRYFRWTESNTRLVKDYFGSCIMDKDAHGSKGSLPGKKEVIEFIEKVRIFEHNNMILNDQISIIKTKIFNERQKARSSVKFR